jgi:hypothetical protein
MKYSERAATWFSTYLLKAIVRRVNRRIDIGIARFWRST